MPVKKEKKTNKQRDVRLVKGEGFFSTNLNRFEYLHNPFYSPDIGDQLTDQENYLKSVCFATLVKRVHEFALTCAYHPSFKIGDRERREKAYKDLGDRIEDIKFLLNQLKPRKKKMKAQILRIYEQIPEEFVNYVDNELRPGLRKYYKPPYRREDWIRKKNDIKKYYKSLTGKEYPKNIFVEDRSEGTIVISIMAYRLSCNYSQLYGLYSKTRKKLRTASPSLYGINP